jgi:hypothetical protein
MFVIIKARSLHHASHAVSFRITAADTLVVMIEVPEMSIDRCSID